MCVCVCVCVVCNFSLVSSYRLSVDLLESSHHVVVVVLVKLLLPVPRASYCIVKACMLLAQYNVPQGRQWTKLGLHVAQCVY